MALLNVNTASTSPAPMFIGYERDPFRLLNVPVNVAVEVVGSGVGDGDGAIDVVGEGDGEGDVCVGDGVGVGVGGDQPDGSTDSKNSLPAVFQCVARYEPVAGFVEK